LLIQEETIEGDELEALFDSPRPKPDLVGPPTGRPALRVPEQMAAVTDQRKAERQERESPPSAPGHLRPQPAG
jgi:cell division protease FtsH